MMGLLRRWNYIIVMMVKMMIMIQVGSVTHRMQTNPVTLTALSVLGFLDNKRNMTASIRNTMNKVTMT